MTSKPFIHDNFILRNKTAESLYHDHAEKMPIYDYHCHLPAKEIAEDARYENAAQLWLGGDHYKWRIMRTNGTPEEEITGSAPDYTRFLRWAEAVEGAVGNPAFHWTQLELKRYFDIDDILNSSTAKSIWERMNEAISRPEFSAQKLIVKSGVTHLCTTDDPADSLEHHEKLLADVSFPVTVAPAFRPDKGLNLDQEGFPEWTASLSRASGVEIRSLRDFLDALEKRMDAFHAAGCRISDHGMDRMVFRDASGQAAAGQAAEKAAGAVLEKALAGKKPTEDELTAWKSYLMLFLGEGYHRRGWTMQLHIGAMRRVNSRMTALLGPDTGFDSIADYPVAEPLGRFLDSLDRQNSLPKTILYCLNPGDNELLATMIGNFQGGGIPGKMQFGSGWWFNDQKDGMERQLTSLASLGLLSRFVGMLTDSRSFLSYPRHEYFRRILCNLVGSWVEAGEFPADMELLGTIIRDISYNNALRYFDIPAKNGRIE
jgi:glucuronate isomerase